MLDFLQRGIANRGADRAASAIEAGNQRGIGAIQGFYDQANTNLSPYMQYGQGQGGIGGLQSLMSGDYSGFMNSPDYMAARDAMQYAGDHGAAARGNVFSGGHQVDMAGKQGALASQYLGNYRNALQWGAGLGQNSAMGLGQLGQQAGGNIANLYSDSGAARAGQHSAYANNTNNMLGNIASNIGSIFGFGG